MPVTRRREPPSARPAEVDVGRRVPGRQADERRDAVVDDLLVARSLRDARRVCDKHITHTHTSRSRDAAVVMTSSKMQSPFLRTPPPPRTFAVT